MKKTIHLSNELSIPLEIVTRKSAMMGGNNGGKTYAATKLIEEILSSNGWVIIFDPVGVHYGLRLKSDGKTPSGLDIPIFGGLHGDIQIVPESGAMIADLLFDRRLSAILDVSQFSTDADVTKFSHDFMDRFYFRMKTTKRAVLIVLEECQEFIPQNPQKGEEKKLHVFARAAKLGRNYGIGFLLISQRPQEISKKVLNLTQIMFAFNMTGYHERKAMDEWFTYAGVEAEKISSILPTLQTGYPYVVSPSWLKYRGQIHVLPKRTFDSSATPDFDGDDAETVSLTPIDISEIEKSMSAVIEKAKADDPAELRKKIRTLEKELEQAKRTPAPAAPAPDFPKEIPVPIFDQKTMETMAEMRKANEEAARAFQMSADQIDRVLTTATDTARGFLDDFRKRWEPIVGTGKTPVKKESPFSPYKPIQPKGKDVSISTLSPGEQKILTACAQYPDGVSKDQLSVLVGYKRSSRDTYLARLSLAGFVVTNSGLIYATDKGIDFLGDDYEPLPTGNALRSYWINRLSGGERALLAELCNKYPHELSKDDLGDLTGYKRSSRDTYLAKLTARRLITTTRPGYVRANDSLFG